MRSKRVAILTVFALFALALSAAPVAANLVPCAVGSPGYWMNHPEVWPTDSLLGLTKAEAIYFMKRDGKHDKTLTMFSAYAAARLNQLAGCDTSCPIPGPGYTVGDAIAQAEAWLSKNPPGNGVRAKSDAWQTDGELVYYWLDQYVNGMLCVPARD
jgi:hypothetical protein